MRGYAQLTRARRYQIDAMRKPGHTGAATAEAKSDDTLGPITRSARDVARVYEAVRGPDPENPETLGIAADDSLAQIEIGVSGLRPGAMPAAGREGVDGDVLAACQRATRHYLRRADLEPRALGAA